MAATIECGLTAEEAVTKMLKSGQKPMNCSTQAEHHWIVLYSMCFFMGI